MREVELCVIKTCLEKAEKHGLDWKATTVLVEVGQEVLSYLEQSGFPVPPPPVPLVDWNEGRMTPQYNRISATASITRPEKTLEELHVLVCQNTPPHLSFDVPGQSKPLEVTTVVYRKDEMNIVGIRFYPMGDNSNVLSQTCYTLTDEPDIRADIQAFKKEMRQLFAPQAAPTTVNVMPVNTTLKMPVEWATIT